jgi:hypothetical protein
MRAYHISINLVSDQEGFVRLNLWKLSEDKVHDFRVRLSDSDVARYNESIKDVFDFLASQVFYYLDPLERSV